MNLVLGYLVFIDHEEWHKYHDYQGVQGIMLAFIRVLTYVAFVYGLYVTRTEHGNAIKKKIPFLNLLTWAGSIYFLSLPLNVLFATFVAPMNKQMFVTWATLIEQFLALTILLYEFVGKKSSYGNASVDNDWVLPHDKGL